MSECLQRVPSSLNITRYGIFVLLVAPGPKVSLFCSMISCFALRSFELQATGNLKHMQCYALNDLKMTLNTASLNVLLVCSSSTGTLNFCSMTSRFLRYNVQVCQKLENALNDLVNT